MPLPNENVIYFNSLEFNLLGVWEIQPMSSLYFSREMHQAGADLRQAWSALTLTWRMLTDSAHEG